jgi:hypothetical protein
VFLGLVLEIFWAIPLTRNLCLLLTLFAALTLSGCIPIPIFPGANPFEKRVGFIRVDQTNRAEVIAKLSAPPIVRRHERFFGYIAYEGGYGVGSIGGGGATFFHRGASGLTARFVGIEFDEQNIVTHCDQAAVKLHIGVVPKLWRVCLPTGVCIDFHKGAVVASLSSQEDARAKRFQSVPDRCAIYLVRADKAPEGELPGPRLFPVYMDGAHAGESGPGTYFYWIISPGQHTIEAKPLGDDRRSTVFLSDSTNKGHGGSVQFACSPAEKVFVRQNSLGRFEIVPEQEGKEAVQQSEKLLDNF